MNKTRLSVYSLLLLLGLFTANALCGRAVSAVASVAMAVVNP